MNEIYLMIVIIVAGIIELSKFLKENNQKEKIVSFVISSCYFGECIFYYIVKDNLISTIGCVLCGCILVGCLIFRFSRKKNNAEQKGCSV